MTSEPKQHHPSVTDQPDVDLEQEPDDGFGPRPGRPDVDTLVQTVSAELAVGNLSKGLAALSDLAARARRVEVADLRHQTDLRIVREQRDRAEAAEADRDRAEDELRGLRSQMEELREKGLWPVDRLARRVTELEAALEEIEDGTTSDRIGQYSALRDWVNRTARGALAGDGGSSPWAEPPDVPDDPEPTVAGDGGGAGEHSRCLGCGLADGDHAVWCRWSS